MSTPKPQTIISLQETKKITKNRAIQAQVVEIKPTTEIRKDKKTPDFSYSGINSRHKDRLNGLENMNQAMNEEGISLMKDTLTSPLGLARLKSLLDEQHNAKGDNHVIISVFAFIDMYKNGKTVAIQKDIKEKAKNSEFTESEFKGTAQHIVQQFGFIIIGNGNGTQWAGIGELNKINTAFKENVGVKVKQSTNKIINKAIALINKKLSNRRNIKQLAHAKTDPYTKIHSDGSLEIINKPFQGEMNDVDKALIRKRNKAQATAKIKQDILTLNNSEHKKKILQLQQRHELELNALAHQADLDIQESSIENYQNKQQQKSELSNKLTGYAKVALVISAIIILIYLIQSSSFTAPDSSITLSEGYQPW